MRIAISADNNNGLDSIVSPHFGRCPYFVLVDMDEQAVKTVKAVEKTGSPVAVIVSTDGRYTTDGVALAKALKALPSIKHLVLAGMPKEIVDDLKAAGVDEFIHIRSDVLASLTGLADTLGVEQ